MLEGFYSLTRKDILFFFFLMNGCEFFFLTNIHEFIYTQFYYIIQQSIFLGSHESIIF